MAALPNSVSKTGNSSLLLKSLFSLFQRYTFLAFPAIFPCLSAKPRYYRYHSSLPARRTRLRYRSRSFSFASQIPRTNSPSLPLCNFQKHVFFTKYPVYDNSGKQMISAPPAAAALAAIASIFFMLARVSPARPASAPVQFLHSSSSHSIVIFMPYRKYNISLPSRQ